jgi:murein DD-endopeptidase MepM/ murein hydrolase activator NlpD
LERTFPQKVKPVPSCEVEEGVMVSQIRQTPPEVNRLVRTSAAMIGLAISVGAYGLPLPNQTDEAIAAEPLAGEPTANALPSEFDIAAVPHRAELPERTQGSSAPRIIEHTVQEGQTLWQLAQFYQVDAATVALNNGISTAAVLHVGQVLKIPTSSQQVVTTASGVDAVNNTPEYYGLIEGARGVDTNQKVVSQAQYGEALAALRQKQERLRLSLVQLKAANQNDALQAPGQSAPATAAQIAPEPATIASDTAVGAPYRVAQGDTLGAIAKLHSVSLRQLVAANRLSDPNVLHVNQVLVIPQASAKTSVLSPAALPVMIASADTSRVTLPAKAVKARGIAVLPSQLSQESSEQALPTVSLTKSSVMPTAIGGSTDVATTSFGASQPAPAEQSGSGVRYSYVENLRLEIVKLREKYQDAASQVQPVTEPTAKVAAATLNVAAPANAASSSTTRRAELEPTRYTKALQAQIRHLQATRQQSKQAEMQQSAAADLAPVASKEKPQLVATASIGSQSYEPLIQSSVGKMVSPDLPPLGSVDAYLPGNTGKFKGYIWPAKGLLTSGFGWRWGRMHKGIDIAAPVGTPVFAAAAGVVITAGWNSGGYGNMVEIQHPDGSVTLYAHNSRIVVREGQTVAQGQQIADMGSTGYSTGPHSHFEVHLPGQGAVNPMAHLPRGQA